MQKNNYKQFTVLHVISGLQLVGGAESVLTTLVCHSATLCRHVVVSLQESGALGERIRSYGIEVVELRMRRGRVSFSSMYKLFILMRNIKPNVVQTWMYHSDLLGGLIARLTGVRSVVWGIHSFNLDKGKISFSARASAWLCARLSLWIPAVIVSCSEQSVLVHKGLGYRADKFVIVPNGYDLSCFAPDIVARQRIRDSWGIATDETLLGMVARWDTQKDHANLLGALALLAEQCIHFRCVLVGRGMEYGNVALSSQIECLRLSGRLILVGPRNDIVDIMNALDLHVLSSAGESFPNVVAESMASGTPCVVTDVGDTALIVGDTGWVVPPGNAAALAQGIVQGLAALRSHGRESMGSACRKRIAERFSVEKMVQSYLQLWRRVDAAKDVI